MKYLIMYSIELETISAFEYYGIADNNPDLTKAIHLRYTLIIYKYILVKFGKLSPVTKYLMKEIVIVKVKTSHLSNSSQQPEVDIIFNEYYKAKVPFEPQWL